MLNRKTDDTTIYDASYYYNDGAVWDHVGNPLKKVEYFGTDGPYTTIFDYDDVYRLTQEQRTDPTQTVDHDAAYSYDAVGNRLSMTLNGVTTTYTYGDNDKLVSASAGSESASFGYDGAGNMTSVTGSLLGTWTLVYDDASRLVELTYPYSGGGSVTTPFYYNALGQLKRKTLGSLDLWYEYFGDRVAAAVLYPYTGSGFARYTLESPSYYGPLLHWTAGGTYHYPLWEGTGHIRRVVDATGAEENAFDFDGFGRYIGEFVGAYGTPYRFGGSWGYFTDSSGLLRLGARFYWPEIGRFIQQDPVGDGLNWYAYVGNNPVVWVDPEGMARGWAFAKCMASEMTGIPRGWIETAGTWAGIPRTPDPYGPCSAPGANATANQGGGPSADRGRGGKGCRGGAPAGGWRPPRLPRWAFSAAAGRYEHAAHAAFTHPAFWGTGTVMRDVKRYAWAAARGSARAARGAARVSLVVNAAMTAYSIYKCAKE